MMPRTSAPALVLLGLVWAALPVRADVVVDPPFPTTADSIRITVAGASSNPCVGVSSSHTVIDGSIHVAVRLTAFEGICIQMLGWWEVTETVGPLAAGDHDLLVTVEAPCCFPCGAGLCVEHHSVRVDAEPDLDTAASGTCVGDCHGSGSVTVAEIITMVAIALGEPLDACRAGDGNGDGQITVDDILTAVNNALRGGCPPPTTPPMPTLTPTLTPRPPSPSPTPTLQRSAAVAACTANCQAALRKCGDAVFYDEYESVQDCAEQCVHIIEGFAADVANPTRCVDAQVQFIQCCTMRGRCASIPPCDAEFIAAVNACGGSFGGCPLTFF